jgi:hypothetical protein
VLKPTGYAALASVACATVRGLPYYPLERSDKDGSS